MAVPSYGDKLIPFCEETGFLEVKRLRLQNHFHSLDWDAVDRWLSVKEAERSDESLSISRKALRNSERATNIAISAIVLSISMAILEIIKWLSK